MNPVDNSTGVAAINEQWQSTVLNLSTMRDDKKLSYNMHSIASSTSLSIDLDTKRVGSIKGSSNYESIEEPINYNRELFSNNTGDTSSECTSVDSSSRMYSKTPPSHRKDGINPNDIAIQKVHVPVVMVTPSALTREDLQRRRTTNTLLPQRQSTNNLLDVQQPTKVPNSYFGKAKRVISKSEDSVKMNNGYTNNGNEDNSNIASDESAISKNVTMGTSTHNGDVIKEDKTICNDVIRVVPKLQRQNNVVMDNNVNNNQTIEADINTTHPTDLNYEAINDQNGALEDTESVVGKEIPCGSPTGTNMEFIGSKQASLNETYDLSVSDKKTQGEGAVGIIVDNDITKLEHDINSIVSGEANNYNASKACEHLSDEENKNETEGMDLTKSINKDEPATQFSNSDVNINDEEYDISASSSPRSRKSTRSNVNSRGHGREQHSQTSLGSTSKCSKNSRTSRNPRNYKHKPTEGQESIISDTATNDPNTPVNTDDADIEDNSAIGVPPDDLLNAIVSATMSRAPSENDSNPKSDQDDLVFKPSESVSKANNILCPSADSNKAEHPDTEGADTDSTAEFEKQESLMLMKDSGEENMTDDYGDTYSDYEDDFDDEYEEETHSDVTLEEVDYSEGTSDPEEGTYNIDVAVSDEIVMVKTTKSHVGKRKPVIHHPKVASQSKSTVQPKTSRIPLRSPRPQRAHRNAKAQGLPTSRIPVSTPKSNPVMAAVAKNNPLTPRPPWQPANKAPPRNLDPLRKIDHDRNARRQLRPLYLEERVKLTPSPRAGATPSGTSSLTLSRCASPQRNAKDTFKQNLEVPNSVTPGKIKITGVPRQLRSEAMMHDGKLCITVKGPARVLPDLKHGSSSEDSGPETVPLDVKITFVREDRSRRKTRLPPIKYGDKNIRVWTPPDRNIIDTRANHSGFNTKITMMSQKTHLKPLLDNTTCNGSGLRGASDNQGNAQQTYTSPKDGKLQHN